MTGGAVVTNGPQKERRGFASMSPEKQREIASKGGRAAHEKGTAHEWSADEADVAGSRSRRTSVQRNDPSRHGSIDDFGGD
jgi:general stress protein YciG